MSGAALSAGRRQAESRRRSTPLSGSYFVSRLVTYLIMAVLLITTVYPLLWMVFGSLKTGAEFYTNIWGFPAHPDFANFVRAWNDAGLGRKFLNSLIATVGTLVLTLPITSMAGYALARLRFPGSRAIYVFLLLGIMVPGGIIAIPAFSVLVSMHLLNTLQGLILIYAAQNVPLGIFLMYSFFASIPEELEEAAMVDGCSPVGAFVRVVLPLTLPGLATQVILTGTGVWNEYFMASVLIHNANLETLPLGLVVFTGKYGTNFPELFAALLIVTLPMLILYLGAQRQFIGGLAAGAVKG